MDEYSEATSLSNCMTFLHCNLDSVIRIWDFAGLACEKYETKKLVLIIIVSLMHHSSFPQYVDILVLVKCVTNTCHSSDRVHSACHLNIEILTPRNITSNVSPETLRFPIKFNILSSPQNSFHC